MAVSGTRSADGSGQRWGSGIHGGDGVCCTLLWAGCTDVCVRQPPRILCCAKPLRRSPSSARWGHLPASHPRRRPLHSSDRAASHRERKMPTLDWMAVSTGPGIRAAVRPAEVEASLAGCEEGGVDMGARATTGRRLVSQKRLRSDGGRVESMEPVRTGEECRLGADRVSLCREKKRKKEGERKREE